MQNLNSSKFVYVMDDQRVYDELEAYRVAVRNTNKHIKFRKKASPRKNSKAKGARGENAIVHKFSEWWGSEFTRTPQSGGFATKQFRDEWNASGDIVSPDETFPFCVEVKHREAWTFDCLFTLQKSTIWSWWEQCIRETPQGKIPLLVFRKNRGQWFIMFYSETFGALDRHFEKIGSVHTLDEKQRIISIAPLEWLMQISKEDILKEVSHELI